MSNSSITIADLPGSGMVVSPSSSWEAYCVLLQGSVHPADFWMADLTTFVSVSNVKSLRTFASRSPVGTCKLAILHNASEFRIETANALLKLLEEPPEYLRILLLSESEHVLPTIKSRVRLLQLPGSATINNQRETATLWQNVYVDHDIASSKDRAQLSNLLYMDSLIHATIKPEQIIEPYSRS